MQSVNMSQITQEQEFSLSRALDMLHCARDKALFSQEQPPQPKPSTFLQMFANALTKTTKPKSDANKIAELYQALKRIGKNPNQKKDAKRLDALYKALDNCRDIETKYGFEGVVDSLNKHLPPREHNARKKPM